VAHLMWIRSFFAKCGALLLIYRALFRIYMALLWLSRGTFADMELFGRACRAFLTWMLGCFDVGIGLF